MIGVTGARPPRADAPECQDAFRAESTSQSSADAPRSAGEPKCAEAKKLSERLKCESLGMTPACAPSPRDLEQKANLLTFEIETELTKYGELLKRDWTHVSNRQRLCAFSMAELDRNYEIATQNPKILGALQERASSIQNCQTVWERHVSPRQVEDMSAVGTDTAPKSLDGLAGGDNRRGLTPVPSPSDSLPDNLVRDMRTQLDKLKPGMARLSESVRILQNATKTIEQVARFHMLFCDPNGTVKAGK
ncbi:hypothetical protein [Blastochloris sulfoviridis]|uniref:Uncharacterized protein n=1 Tax=Blastochloris sulfoviridis TaxID=50712 RepID=A0A5M6HR99_9HYPH|nr:hypothetical protein [Blastochloris sulfoviridis]KAA5598228.1 hypothetical protein F1193_13655 [Blastochloris sulfoviridis]